MIKSVYPVIMTDKLEESSSFYKTYFGFMETFTSDWYISLLHPSGNELAFIDAKHGTIPEPHQSLAKGMILNIEVENATQMHKDIAEKNESIVVMPLCDEEYGQRHFMLQDPNDIFVDVIENIPTGEAYQENYVAADVAETEAAQTETTKPSESSEPDETEKPEE